MKNVIRLASNQGWKQSKINLGTLAPVLALSLLCPLREVQAAGLANPVYKIEIEYKAHNKQASEQATVTMPDKTSGVLDSEPTKIIVPSGSTPKLEVVNANPALFFYGIDEVSVQQNQTNKVLEDFISKLSGAVPGTGLVASQQKAAGFASPKLRGMDFQALQLYPKCTIKIAEVNGVDVNKFLLTTLPQFAKLISTAPGTKDKKENNLPQAIEEVSINPTQGGQKHLESAIDEINGLVTFQDDLINLERIRKDPLGEIHVKFTSSDPQICPAMPNPKDPVSGFTALQQHELQKTGAKWEDLSPSDLAINLLAHKFDQYSDAFTLATDLAKEASKIGQSYPLKTKEDAPIVVDYAHDSKVTFSIAKNNKYAPLLTSATKDFQNEVAGLGKKSVVMTIENEFSVSVAPGAAYSFVQNPQYAVTSKNGQLVISETSNDYNKLNPAIVINISRSKYEGQSMTPHLQVGVIPQSNNLGFLLGGGFHSGGNLSFALGIVYQKANSLKAGLSVGQVVANTADLQTESKYKTGLYFSIGYDVVPKK